MKLNFEILTSAPSKINAIKDRELDLRGIKAPEIENLALTKDQNDTIDLTDNEIRRLENFPKMTRLKYLLVSNNKISYIQPDLAKYLPNLNSLILINNSFVELGDLDPLSEFRYLEHLAVMDNAVANKELYREYVIFRCRKLRVLDFKRITDKERKAANARFTGAEGSQLAKALSNNKSQRTFEPGQVPGVKSEQEIADAARIKAAISKATTLEQVQMLEKQLQAGYVPSLKKMI